MRRVGLSRGIEGRKFGEREEGKYIQGIYQIRPHPSSELGMHRCVDHPRRCSRDRQEHHSSGERKDPS